MARTSSPKRLTRLDRDAASVAAGSFDLGPPLRGAAVVAAVVVLVLAVAAVVPDPPRFGGALQSEAAPTFTTVRKAGQDRITIGVTVPWNAGEDAVMLEELAAISTGGIQIEKTGVLPSGQEPLQPARGFPPAGLSVLPVEGYGVEPGGNALDGFQIAVGLRGNGSVLGFALRYRSGDATLTAFIPVGVMLCGTSCEGKDEVVRGQQELAARLGAFIDVPSR